jgi:surface polysaccharide O-acyltransferase-like enzyme
VLGFASRHIRGAEGPVLRYLTDAVFPCYLAHQTILVIAAHHLKRLDLPAGTEAVLLVSITLGGSLLIYEIVRRIGPIRPLWGLKPRVRGTPAATKVA